MDRQKWWIVEFLCYNLSWASILGFFSTIRSDNIESRKLERGGWSYPFFFSNSFRSINFSKRSKRKVLKRKVKKKKEKRIFRWVATVWEAGFVPPSIPGWWEAEYRFFHGAGPRSRVQTGTEWPVVEYAYIRSNKIYCSVNCTRERMGKQNETKRYTCRPTKCTESRIARSHVANAPRNPRKREFHVPICDLPEAASP